MCMFVFFFNDTATTEIYTLSLHDALPIYREWADVFSIEKSDQLPEHSAYDHHINLHPGTKPPFGPLYPCSDSELKVLKEYRSEEHTSDLQSPDHLLSPLLLEKKTTPHTST